VTKSWYRASKKRAKDRPWR